MEKLEKQEGDAQLIKEFRQLLGTSPEEASAETLVGQFTQIEDSRIRGGRGGKGKPNEIRKSVDEARREAVRIDHDLTRLKNDKEALLFIVADLRVKERQMVDKKLTKETDYFREEIAKALKKLEEINGVIPEANISEDHKKVQKIISEWSSGKRDWRKENEQFKEAEKKLEKNPDDRRAQGDANRARAEMKATGDGLERVANDAKVIEENEAATPAQNESVLYTHEQAVLDRKEWEKRHKTEQEEAVLEAVPVVEQVEVVPLAVPIQEDSVHTEALQALQEEIVEESVNPVQLSPEVEASLSPEQSALIKRCRYGLSVAEREVRTRAERASAVDAVRKVGEVYNKIPRHYKWLFAGGLLVSGAGAVALGATFAVGATGTLAVVMRGLGGAGLFVTFEKMLKGAEEKKTGLPRSKNAELRHTAEASALAIIVGALLPNMIHDTVLASGIPDAISEYFNSTEDVAPPTQPLIEEIPEVSPSEYTGVAEAGDSRWSLAERALTEGPYKDQFNQITSREQRMYIIDSIKDRLVAGMTEGEADTLSIGDKIDFKEIFNDKGFMDNAFTGAQGLNPEEATSIHNDGEALGIPEVGLTPVETLVSTQENITSPENNEEMASGQGQPLLTEFTPPENEVTYASGETVSFTPEITDTNATPETNIMPQEILPSSSQGILMEGQETTNNPQAISLAKKQVHDIIESIWGKKGGWFGIGSSDGMEVFSNFSDKTVEEVMKMDATSTNKEVQDLLGQAYEQTRVKSAHGEKVMDYLNRATAVGIDRFLENK